MSSCFIAEPPTAHLSDREYERCWAIAAAFPITDSSRLRREVGFSEALSREEAIRRTVEWDLANPPTGFTPHQFDYEAEDAATTTLD